MTAQSAPLRGRPVALCPADGPICPRCARMLPGLLVGPGSAAFMRCPNRRPRLGRHRPPGPSRCNQWCYLLGAHGGVCVVVPITAAEYEALTAEESRGPLEVLKTLGVLIA